MRIFDVLTNLSPDQNQGLLAAAAALLQAGGPSRTPTSFGQALGGGLQAFQQAQIDAEGRRLQRDQQGLNSKLLGLKIQDAESDLANQAAARKRAGDLSAFYQKDAQGGGGLAQAIPALIQASGNADPTVENADILSRIQAMQSPQQQIAGASRGRTSLYDQRIAQADRLRAAGFVPEADAAEAAALKFQPKVKGWEKVQQDGKVMFAPYFEDGTSGAPVPYEVAEKLEKVGTGGSTDLVNSFTGATVRSLKNTASPDALLSAATTRRGQDLVNARALDANKAGKLTEDQAKATGWLVQAQQAYDNLKKVAFDKDGNIQPAARAGANDLLAGVPLVGETSANYFRTAPRQQFLQAASSMSEAFLRAATGAGVNRDEALQKVREITPQVGDSEEVIQQKFDAIPAFIESLRVRSGPGGAQAEGILNTSRESGNSNGWSITQVRK